MKTTSTNGANHQYVAEIRLIEINAWVDAGRGTFMSVKICVNFGRITVMNKTMMPTPTLPTMTG